MTSSTWLSARLRYSTAALLTASVLVLTACNGGGNPPGNDPTSASASASTSASATPSPTATPSAAYKPADAKGKAQNVPVPVLPEAASEKSKAGLEAFAKHWYALLNYAFETGDLEPVKAVTGSPCAMCDKIFPSIVKWNAEGRWVSGANITVHAAQTNFVETRPAEFQVAVQSQQRAGTLYNADASVGQTVTESGMLGDLIVAKYDGGSWRALNVDRLGG
jgi:hypothetical protein